MARVDHLGAAWSQGLKYVGEIGRAVSREDHRAASDMREKSETPDDDSSETPRGMIDN